MLGRVAAAVAIAAIAGTAHAQPPQPEKKPAQRATPQRPTSQRPKTPKKPGRVDRGYITVGGALQVTPTRFSDSSHPIDFGEAGLVASSFRFAAAPAFDISGAAHVKRRFSIGADLSMLTKSGTDTIAAMVPHPFFFDRLRPVNGQAPLHRRETALHIQAIWTRPLVRRWQASLSAGPSAFNVSQDVVDDVSIAQSYPYDTATFTGAVSKRRSAWHAGFNVGAACDYAATRRLAVRVGLNYAHASVPFTAADAHTLTVGAGGLRLGAGLLVRF